MIVHLPKCSASLAATAIDGSSTVYSSSETSLCRMRRRTSFSSKPSIAVSSGARVVCAMLPELMTIDADARVPFLAANSPGDGALL